MNYLLHSFLVYTGHHVLRLSPFRNDLGGYSVLLTIGFHHCNTDSLFQIKMHRLWRNEHMSLDTDLELFQLVNIA